ncbi:MAG: O-antigen ligase family protein [Chitinophagales bacterium]|nr:O-antigen ligase family protein [Chitinophagales bacterium]
MNIKSFLYFFFILWCVSTGWSTALISVLMTITSLLIIIDSIKNKNSFIHFLSLVFPTIALFFIIAISSLWSSDIAIGLKNTKAYLPFLLFPYCFQYILKNNRKAILTGIRFLGFSLLVAYFITIIWNIIPQEKAYQLSTSLSGLVKPFTFSDKYLFGWYVPFMERIHFSNLLSLSALSFVFLFFRTKKIYDILIALILSSAPFLLGARASMIGVLMYVSFLFIYAIRKSSKKISLYILIGGIVVGSMASFLFYPNIKARYNQTMYELKAIQDHSLKDKDYTHFATLTRFVSWRHAWDLFVEKPVVGYGIGDYLSKYEARYHEKNADLQMTYHSQFLYFLGVFGIMGFTLFLISYLYYGFQLQISLSKMYFLCFTIYIFCVWFFDTGLLQKKEMMAFTLFICFAQWLEKSETSSI